MLVARLQDLIALIETSDSPPAVDGDAVPVTTASLDPLRDRIDALDRAILLLLNERAVYANAIGRIKKVLGMPVYVPSREEEVLRNVTEHNGGPLSDAAVRRLFERVIDETRTLERHIYHDEPDTGSVPEPARHLPR